MKKENLKFLQSLDVKSLLTEQEFKLFESYFDTETSETWDNGDTAIACFIDNRMIEYAIEFLQGDDNDYYNEEETKKIVSLFKEMLKFLQENNYSQLHYFI